jgi:transposase-like protein
MRARYPTELKVEAIRRVVHEGRAVVDVAQEFGVGEGSVFFWVRRYREFVSKQRASRGGWRYSLPPLPGDLSARDVGTLAAFLRRL